MADLIQNNLALEERLDKQGTWLYNLENLNIPHKVSQAVDEIVTDAMFEDNSYQAHEVHNDLYEALQKSLELDYSNQRLADQEEARKKKRKKRVAPRTPSMSPPSLPPPPPPPAGASGALAQELSPTDSLMQDDSILDEQKPLPEEERPVTLEPAWIILSSNVSDVKNNWDSALVSTSESPAKNSLLAKTGDITTFMKCILPRRHSPSVPDGGVSQDAHSSGHVTVQPQFFFNKDLEYLRYGSKGSNPALLISKMKAASYPDFGLELLVPKQMWIEDVADFQEHTIAEKDFKNLYPSDFEDLNLLLLQGHLDHLPGSDKRILSTAVKLWTQNLVIRQWVEDFQLGIESYQTQLNLTKPGWDATGYEFKHDYTIVESPRAVVYPVDNNHRKIMRFNEIYKFSDGTLTHILEVLDYRVKEFKVKRLNPGMNTRFWTEKDVPRSKEFIAAIESLLKTRRIYRNLECFVGGRVRDIDYRLLQRTE
ncbi:hypothetical protein Tco_0590178 [Tanacetum coccineum]